MHTCFIFNNIKSELKSFGKKMPEVMYCIDIFRVILSSRQCDKWSFNQPLFDSFFMMRLLSGKTSGFLLPSSGLCDAVHLLPHYQNEAETSSS